MNDSVLKTVAYFLPQYHQIPENDEWWGKGFTEWDNVKRAQPIFDGHLQPLKPYDYYDLSDPSVLRSQISMAKKYGLFGFCFHYYWFSGKRLLEKPIENFLKDDSPEADFPFMLCWANENWTRTWDGLDENSLISQNHSIEDHYNASEDLFRYMADDRYIKIDNKPVLVIYRPAIVDHFDSLVEILRKKALEKGFDGIKIISTNSFHFKNLENFSIDGIVEFPPHFDNEKYLQKGNVEVYAEFTGNAIMDYSHTVNAMKAHYQRKLNQAKSGSYYPCCFPSWDNIARRQHAGNTFTDASPELFEEWMDACASFTNEYNQENEKFLFINAWNEWAEGAILEPDQDRGFAHLEVLNRVVSKHNK